MTDKDVSHAEMVEAVAQQFDVDAEAAEFLNQHPHLYSVLLESVEQIHNIFGQDVELQLRFVKDPEIPNYQTLFCYIWVSMSVAEALEKLDVFEDEYYLQLPNDIIDDLIYDVRCR